MLQTREKMRTPLFRVELTFKWCEGAIGFLAFIFIFCLGPTVRNSTWMRATSVTVMVMFSKVPF